MNPEHLILLLAFIFIAILLYRCYTLKKKHVKACYNCDEKILIGQLEAENKNKSRIDFLSMVLDEIRIPMNGIISTSSLFLRTDMTAEQQQYVHTIRRSSVVLLTVVNDILDLSKIESGTFTLEKTPFVLKDHINEVLALMSIDQSQFQIIYDDALPEVIESDPAKLKQIVISLIANMMHMGGSWGAVLNVNVLSEKNNEIEIGFKLALTNNETDGATPAATQNFAGAIGLSISARLAAVMGGHFKTEDSSGSRILFSIKGKKIVAGNHTNNNQKDIPNGKVDAMLAEKMPLKILVANGDLITQILLSSALLKMGYTCLVARTGAECIQLAVDNKVDLVFIDRHMPGIDGLQVTAEIRNYYMNAQNPVIVNTTANPFYDKEEGEALGVNDYIIKPFKPKDIEQMIKKWGRKV